LILKKELLLPILKKHEWFNGKFLEGKDLIRALRVKHRLMEQKRVKDARKMGDLQNSIIRKPIPDIEKLKQSPPLFPSSDVEGIHDTYTFVHWKKFFNKIYDYIGNNGGKADFDPKTFILNATLKIDAINNNNNNDNNNKNEGPTILKFEIQMWKSREFMNIQKPSDIDNDNNNNKEVDEQGNQDIYVVRIKRLDGEVAQFKKFEKMLMDKTADVFTGLPTWVDEQLLNEQDEQSVSNFEDNNNYEEEEQDNYGDIAQKEMDNLIDVY
jgi:hypothetical protein